ncbi:MAG: ATP-binding protein [Clostridiaceae bacterium]
MAIRIKKEKEKSKRTLKKRILRAISWSSFITILIFSSIIFLLFIMFFKAMGNTISDYKSNKIATEFNSGAILNELNIDNIDEIDNKSIVFLRWIEKTSHDMSFSMSAVPKNPKMIKDEDILYFTSIEIVLNNNILYETEKSKNITEFDSFLNDKIVNTEVSTDIYDSDSNVIGYVKISINQDITSSYIKILFGIMLLTLLISYFISRLINRAVTIPILKPLNYLLNTMEKISEENLEDISNISIEIKKPLEEIERLANSTNKIVYKMKKYTDLLKSQKDDLENHNEELEAMADELKESNNMLNKKNYDYQNIMDNVGQGFITFADDLIIDDEYSLECEKIFKIKINALNFPNIIYLNDEDNKYFLEKILKKIFILEKKTAEDIYMPLLPSEVVINDRFIKIEYKLVYGNNLNKKKKCMVILTDITETKQMEMKMEEEKNILKMVVKSVVNYKDFLECVNDYKEFYSYSIDKIIDMDIPIKSKIYEIYRNIHTYKGNLSQYDLLKTVEGLHNMESSISLIQKQGSIKDLKQLKRFVDKFEMNKWIQEDMKILKSYLGEKYFDINDSFLIEKEQLMELEEQMLNILSSSECKALLPNFKMLRYKSFKELLNMYPDYVDKLSNRMGKVVNFNEIQGSNILVDIDYYHDFTKTLVHIFRNCLDHGIESQDDRLIMGKNEVGNIYCSIEQQKDKILLIIEDDGKGIDFEKIKDKAIENRLYFKEEIRNIGQEELINLMFKEEFSTKEIISEISGRGMGLSSVLNELKKIKGSVEVKSKINEGTKFIFSIPYVENEEIQVIESEEIIESISKITCEIVNDSTGIKLISPSDKNDIKKTDKIPLNKVAAILNVKGVLNFILIISVNEDLARLMVRKYVIDSLTNEEEEAYIEDVVGEFANIIIGNSIKKFGQVGEMLTVGTPTILCYNGASIKCSQNNIYSYLVEEDNYAIGISIMNS